MATLATRELAEAQARSRRRINAGLGLWLLGPRRIGSGALNDAIVRSRVDARQSGAEVAVAQLGRSAAITDSAETAVDRMRAEAATRAYRARLARETKEAETANAARREAKPSLDRMVISETAQSFNDGIVEEARAVAEETGLEYERVWRAEGDACEICAGLDGETIPLGEDFPDGQPGSIHPNCQCTDEVQRK
jgi:putative hemolysin